jgi:hypothetical protein
MSILTLECRIVIGHELLQGAYIIIRTNLRKLSNFPNSFSIHEFTKLPLAYMNNFPCYLSFTPFVSDKKNKNCDF